MRHTFLIVILILLSAHIISGEETTVITPLSNPSILLARSIPSETNRSEIGFDVLPLDQGALVSGSSTPTGGSAPDGLILRITNEGDVTWRKTYGGKGLDLIFSCLPDSENGFVCVGFKSSGGEGAMKAMDGWILRIDQQGTVIWEYTYGGPGEDRLTNIRPTQDGWIAVGHKELPNIGIRAWVLRIDKKGKELSSWTGTGNIPEKGLDVIPLQDGGCIIVGGAGADRESSDGFVSRVAANGARVWNHPITGPGFQVGYHLQAFRDGSFLVISYGYVDAEKNHDVSMLRIRADGKLVYHTRFGGPTNDRATNALILENDTIVVAGQTQRPEMSDEDTGWDGVIYMLDARGKPLWSGRYGGEGVEFGRAVKGSADDIWIIGHTTSGHRNSNVMLLRIDASHSHSK